MTWYHVEDNGNLLTMTGNRDPSWFCMGNDKWWPTVEDAVDRVRRGLAYTVESTRKAADEAELRLERFENAVREL